MKRVIKYDLIVDEIHKIREQHAAELNFNKDLIFDYWLKKSKESNRKYVNFENKIQDKRTKYSNNFFE